MKSIKLVNVRIDDQRKAMSLINDPEFVVFRSGKNNGCGYWSQSCPHVAWWKWKTAGGCVCIQADYEGK